jgi:hypothetical protein
MGMVEEIWIWCKSFFNWAKNKNKIIHIYFPKNNNDDGLDVSIVMVI